MPDYRDIANVSDHEHEAYLADVHHNLARHEGRYRIHRKLSAEANEHFADNSLDFVYLDADHAYEAVAADIRRWFCKLRPGGILAGHDFLDGILPEGDFGVTTAVQEFGTEMGVYPVVTQERWPSWYLVKP